MGEVVAYHRVSTQRQGRSGLGLEAQEAAIARFTSAEGLTVARAFVEVETGKGADALARRPELRKALPEAKRASAQWWWRSSIACRAMWRSSPV
jgi:DNA invertase Pin-like site-specific DNA recombinase